MPNTIAFAITLGVIASFCFASGATLQHLGVKGTFDPQERASQRRLTVMGLLRLFTIPKWLLGLLLVLAGAALHLWALTMAPVTVIQPVGILAVPWSVMLASWIHGHKITSRIWVAVAITVVGLVVFTLISTTSASEKTVIEGWPIAVSVLIVFVLAALLSVAATKAPGWLKAMLWSSVGAIFYGLASGLMKASMDAILKHHMSFGDPVVWGTIVAMLSCYGLGVWMIQQGYASGPAEITVGTMTTVDPVVAVVFGLVVLGEGAGMGILAILGMIVFGAVAIYGVVMLSAHHPDAAAERESDKVELLVGEPL